MRGHPHFPMDAESDRYRILFELGLAFAAQSDLDELVQTIVERSLTVFDAEGFSLLLHDATTDELYFPYVVSQKENVAERLAELRFAADVGIAGEVFQTGKMIRVDAAADDPRVLQPTDVLPGQETHSLICAPLSTPRGRIGVVEATNHHGGNPFTDDDLELLGALAGSIALALDNARLQAELRQDRDRLSIELVAERRDSARHDGFGELIGRSPAMVEVFELLESAAAMPIAVLIHGETGTGKELVARALHDTSPRARQPFIAVNCAALPESLLESELFGHRKGSFTGATEDRIGIFEAAKGGTIFLDEIGEMPAAMQPKLLRVLQEREVVPVGDRRPRPVDIRIVTATNRDLEVEIAERRFRDDLYYRLSAFPVALPPLRNRRSDIAILATHLLARIGKAFERPAAKLGVDTIEYLEAYDWPGNVRELQNELERATVLAKDGAIEVAHLSTRLRARTDNEPAEPALSTNDLREARAAFETRFIRRVLEERDGNVTQSATAIGLSRVGLQKKIKELGIRVKN